MGLDNALADLRHIELAGAGQTLLPEKFALCTCDFALAGFWSALALRGDARGSGQVEFTYDLTPDLLHRLEHPGLAALAARFRTPENPSMSHPAPK